MSVILFDEIRYLMHSPTLMEKAWEGLMVYMFHPSFLKNLTASHSWIDTCACKYSPRISLNNPYPTIKEPAYHTWLLGSFPMGVLCEALYI